MKLVSALAKACALSALLYGGHVQAQNAQPLVPRANEQPSFDCSKAKTASARLICADGELAGLDGQLGVAFQKRKSQIPAAEQQRFVREQVAWIRDRNKQCDLVGKDSTPIETLAASKACMVTAIQERIATFSTAAQKPAEELNAAGPKRAAQAEAAESIRARAADIAALKSGTYVRDSTPCEEASNSTIMNFDGNQFTQGRFCPAPVSGSHGSPIVVTRLCPNEVTGVKEPQVDTFIIKSQTEFVLSRSGGAGGEVDYRYCEQTELPEIWRKAPQTAQALANQVTYKLTDMNCGFTMGCPGCAPGFTPFNEAFFQFGDTSWLLDDSAIQGVLDRVRNEVRNYCEEVRRNFRYQQPVFSKFVLHGISNGQVVLANIDANQSRWNIQFNAIAAQHQAQLQAQQIAQAKQALRVKIQADLGIQTWVDFSQLNANPFVFKGSVVGIFANFDHMISESEALFAVGGSGVYVTHVPPAMFRGQEYVILAGRVTGNHSVKGAFGQDVNVPALEYVGVFNCAQNACQGF
jgi:uncharacterized protein YecT (DUF1311 family)